MPTFNKWITFDKLSPTDKIVSVDAFSTLKITIPLPPEPAEKAFQVLSYLHDPAPPPPVFGSPFLLFCWFPSLEYLYPPPPDTIDECLIICGCPLLSCVVKDAPPPPP